MRVADLRCGKIVLVQVKPIGTELSFTQGCEVGCRADADGRSATLKAGEKLLAVEPVAESDLRLLKRIGELNPPRVCWLADIEPSSKTLSIQMHLFNTRLRLDEPLIFGVDSLVTDRIATELKIAPDKQAAEEQRMLDWLHKQLVLPVEGEPGRGRLVSTALPNTDSRFRLVGSRFSADVEVRNDTYVIAGLTRQQSSRQGFSPAQFIVDAEISLLGKLGELKRTVRSQLDQLVRDAESYIALWQDYQAIERDNLIKDARDAGWVKYRSYRTLADGTWEFSVKDPSGLSTFAYGVEESEADLEISETLPPGLLRDAPTAAHSPESIESHEDDLDSAGKSALGRLVSHDTEKAKIRLRPVDEDSDAVPPSQGVIHIGILGDKIRLKRRAEAIRRIRSAEARMPQLGLILELAHFDTRTVNRVRPLSEPVRKLFRGNTGNGKPTPRQTTAIDLALNTPDIALIQGPPGTGKTKVIAAIQARLAQLEADQPEVAGRTLLTSYQHDAVDNAADRSVVFGLRPVRFGGKRGEALKRSHEAVQRWAQERRDAIRATMNATPEEKPLSQYRYFRDQAAACAAGQLRLTAAQTLIKELLGLPAGKLGVETRRHLREALEAPVQGTLPLNENERFVRDQQLRAVNGLRATAGSFSDDGARKAYTALTTLGDLLSDADRKLLTAVSELDSEATPEQLNELQQLKERLLDRLSPAPAASDSTAVSPAVQEALNEAVADLYEHLQDSKACEADVLQEFADTLEHDPAGVRDLLETYSAVYAATCQQAVKYDLVVAKGGDNSNFEFENVIVDEAARANPLDLFIPMSLARRRIILVGDQRQLPHMLEPNVERELGKSASEATREALRKSLFQRLFEFLRAREAIDGIQRVVTLDQQYRMHPTLGDFVSSTFYAGEEGFESPRPAAEFDHRIEGYLKADRPVCAVWKDVPNSIGNETRGRSKSRPEEARWIAKEVARILKDPRINLNIGVITFYKAQVTEILRALHKEGITGREDESDATAPLDVLPDWRDLHRDDGTRDERLRIGTVDAFQGKEFDVVFLSCVRSNKQPDQNDDQLRKKYGHLLLPNRLCVAMSRQKRLLVAVGDRAMFDTAVAAREVPGLHSFLRLCGGGDGMVT